MKLTNFPGDVLLGAGLMYFFDPVLGPRRRGGIKDAVVHAADRERELLDEAARVAKQRTRGMVERAKHRRSQGVPDKVIESRVRGRLEHTLSQPGAIEVGVDEGRVTLRGPVFTHEADPVLNAVRRVLGVREVVDHLERHDTADAIPWVQRDERYRRRRAWSPTKQVAQTAAGALMLGYGVSLRRGPARTLLCIGGGALLMRAILNRTMPEPIGREHGVMVQKSILVKRPIYDVYVLWTQLDKFPLFMEHVRGVELESGGPKSKWTVDGPAGTKLEFEAVTTVNEPPSVIAWQTLPNQPIKHEGRVRFEEVEGGTRVNVHMEYLPRAEMVGQPMAQILGWDPAARMDDDLLRMKELLEGGKTTAHQERVQRPDLH